MAATGTTTSSAPDLPLAGITLLDLSRVLAGPVCSQVLGDLGATVIKIERPGRGDDTRQWGPPFWHGQSAYFQSVNRNKLSVALDLRNPAAREVLDDLIRHSDLLLENFLPTEVEKFGLSPERLRSLNPDLVSCSISGFGRTGPWRDRPGYDTIVQALSGLMAINGPEAGEPYKVGVAITDVIAGLYAAVCLVSGLCARQAAQGEGTANDANKRKRIGKNFDVALLDCTLASLVNVVQSCLVTGVNPQRFGNAHATIVPYQTFAAQGGHLMLAVGNDAQFARLCAVVGHPEWSTDPRFAENPERVRHRTELVEPLQDLFAAKTVDEWVRLLTDVDVPCAPVQELCSALELPQVQAREMIVESEVKGERLKLLGSPIKVDGQSLPLRTPPPEVGQYTVKVLRELLGYDDQRLAQLRACGGFG